jgi:hypothetical protein
MSATAPIVNPPGRDHVAYRAGDYTGFRTALLQALPNETQLVAWKPTAIGDLALQMVEWWAYLGDILTFYNERIANQDYLRTTDLEESAKRLIRLLGYRPRPGIGAMATLAALVNSTKPVTLPQGFAVQSKPGPGQSPQTFELDTDSVVSPIDEVSADPPPAPVTLGEDGTVMLQGTVSSIKAGDQVVIVEKTWDGSTPNFAIARIAEVKPETDPRGAANTRVRFTAALGLPSDASPSSYRLLRSTEKTRLWQYGGGDYVLTDTGNDTSTMHLEGVLRDIQPGDVVLLSGPGEPPEVGGVLSGGAVSAHALTAERRILFPPMQFLASVRSYTEVLWYANSTTGNPADVPTGAAPPIVILNSQLTFAPAFSGNFDASTLTIRYNWQDAGTLIPTPAKTFSTATPELTALDPPEFPGGNFPVLVEDANSIGISATGLTGSDLTSIQFSDLPLNPATLAAPINVLYNLLRFSRGASIKQEVLGSGDASLTGQEFGLKKSPLTYLLTGYTSAGGNYKSTLRVWVNGIEWTEAQSFYAQPSTATIFVTYEDETNQTHVQFGDGVNGARLPSGTNNVVASYRFGSGAQSPDAGTLTSIINPYPGLQAIRSPVAPTGGADPEPASQIKRYAPLSVLTFGRAVSGDDYEAIAALTPGVARARAYWSFDALQQRTAVTVYVGNDDTARANALLALRADADPNRPIIVKLAAPVALQVSFTLEVDARYPPDIVTTAVRQALVDPQNGLFGSGRVGIGEVIYLSRIYEACLAVPGAVALHDLTRDGYRLDPGEGSYFTLADSDLSISSEVLSNGQ